MMVMSDTRMAAKYNKIVGAVGASLFFSGAIWLGLLIHSRRDYPEWVRYEFFPPLTPRLMVLFGLALLLIFCVRIGLSYLRQRRN
jgi:hypothetical protein